MTDHADIEANARGTVSETELTSTGGKLFKVGYFETPVVDRLDADETVHYVLRNFTDGLQADDTEYVAANKLRSVACVTDRRVLFVVGGEDDGEDGTVFVRFGDVLGVEADDRTFVVRAIDATDQDVTTYRFPVKNDGELDDAVAYVAERASGTTGTEQAEAVDSHVAEADAAREDGRYDDALDALDAALDAYHRYESIADAIDVDAEPTHSRDDLRERRAATETETYQDAYRRHLAHGDRHQEDANADREADDGEAALDAFEEAIDAYQEALAVATEHDVGDAEAVRDRLVDVQTRRDQLEISRYGERVAGVDVPDVEDDPEVDESVFDAAIAELESVLDDVSELDGDRAEEVELVRQEAARKLVRARYERAKYRATRAVAAVHDDDYDEANETFADVATRLDDLASAASDLDVTEYDDDVERLREVCEENADIVRKTSLGLVDDDLIPLDAERSAEGDAERSPSENRAAPTDASRSKPDGARTESSSSSSPSPSPSPSPSQNRRAGTDRSRRGSTDAPDVEDLSYAAVEKHEQIGSGGNADVYRAVATADGTERTVALKEPRMQGTLHADVIDRFVSEAETWSKLDDHPNVVSVVGYGSAPIPWIALEYMDGGDLNAAATTLDVGEKLRIATRVTDAVWHAHQRGIAHLDLKPANILFASDGTESAGTPKVADWGLAKMLLDHSKSVEGLSPRYSAPEQFDSETYGSPDNQTDVYQLGTIVYELLTGTHPFEGRPSEVMHSVLYEEAAPPTSQDPTLPDELDDVLRTAMAKDRTDRYEAAVYLRDRLEDVAP